jgi:hypothetical protein
MTEPIKLHNNAIKCLTYLLQRTSHDFDIACLCTAHILPLKQTYDNLLDILTSRCFTLITYLIYYSKHIPKVINISILRTSQINAANSLHNKKFWNNHKLYVTSHKQPSYISHIRLQSQNKYHEIGNHHYAVSNSLKFNIIIIVSINAILKVAIS